MAIEYLASSADFAHLDGALVYPLFVDDCHVLVVEDGTTLIIPNGLRVHSPGRFGIGADGTPYVDTKVSGEEAHTLALWGQGLQSAERLDFIRAFIEQALSASPNPERYINRAERPREEI